MGNRNNNVLGVDIDVKSIDKQLDVIVVKFRNAFSEINQISSSIGIDDSLGKSIKSAIDDLNKFQNEYKGALHKLNQGKLDVDLFKDFKKNVEHKIQEFDQRVSDVEKTIKDFQTTINGVDGKNLENRLSSMMQEYQSFKSEVTEATKALKVFYDMVASSQQQRINVRTNNLDELEKKLNHIAAILGDGDDLGKGLAIDEIAGKARISFDKLAKEYLELKDKLYNSSDKNEKLGIQKQIEEMIPELGMYVNKLMQSSSQSIQKYISGNLQYVFDGKTKSAGVESVFDRINQDLQDYYLNLNSLYEKAQADIQETAQKISSEVSAEVSTFKFKKGGIRVPVVLDEGTIKQLKPQLENVIDALSAYSAKNPVNVTMRLFSLRGSRDEQREINRELSTIQANIANVQDDNLRNSLNDLLDNLETQYKKSLKLNIEVGLSEKTKDVRNAIKEIQNTVNEEIIQIKPEFVITDEESQKLKDRIDEIQKGFTFNITSEIKEMAQSLKTLLENNNVQEWVNSFTTGLGIIHNKLAEMKPFLDSLTQVTGNKKGGVSQNAKEDITIIDQLTQAIDSLYQSIQEQKNITVDIDLDPLLSKLTELKGTIGLIRLELSHLKTSISNITEVGGVLQVLQRIEQIISELNSNRLEITPKEVNASSFIESINEQITEPVRVPVRPLLSSISSFIDELQQALNQYPVGIQISANQKQNINSAVQNPDIANKLYVNIYQALDQAAENIGRPLKEKIAESLVVGLREGVSNTADILRNGLSGTDYEPIIEQIIGDEETVNTIRNIANEAVKSFDSIINSDLNIVDFFNSINNEIVQSGKVVQIPISVMPESINSFIDEIHNIVNDNIKNTGDTKADNLEDTKKQITSLNQRIGNLQKKISNTWKNWNEFAEASTDAKNVTNENLNSIINKLGEFGIELSQTARSFKNIDFVKPIEDINNIIIGSANPTERIVDIITQMISADSFMKSHKASTIKEYGNIFQNQEEPLEIRINVSNVYKQIQDYLSEHSFSIKFDLGELYETVDKGIQKDTLKTNNTEQINEQIILNSLYDESIKKREKVLQEEQKIRKQISELERKTDSERDKNNTKEVNRIKKQEKAQENLARKIAEWRARNSAAEKEYGTALDDMYSQLTKGASLTDDALGKIETKFNNIRASASQAGNTGKSLFDMIKQRAKSLIATLTTFNSFYDVIRVIRQGYTNVAELNKQMVELAKVSDLSLGQIQDDFQSYSKIAKDYGATISDTISATADWSRLGYSIPDAKELARVALLYKNVGDGIDITAANESLISTLQGYQMTADEAEHVTDVFNQVANNYAIDTAGIGEALQRSAASLNAANTSLEESVALVTAANTVVQNPEQVGTTFKTNICVFVYSNMHYEYI